MVYLFALILTLSAFAKAPCSGSKDHCYKSAPWTMNGMAHAVSHPIVHSNEHAGVYYAKGVGRNCNEAFGQATRKMSIEYDFLNCNQSIRCGTNGGAYLLDQQCLVQKDGKRVAWAVCSNLFHSEYIAPPSMGNTGSGFILLESLKRSEVRARASK